MATADKNKQEQPTLSVESRLKALYRLQTILSQIDRIKTVRGELPLEVRDLEDSIEGLHTRIANFHKEIEELRKKSALEQEKIHEAGAKITKYKEQLDNVRNNREFDLLSKEIEFQTLEIELCEKHINEYARVMDAKTAEIASTEEHLADQEHILADKRKELEEIVSETKQDEERLREEAKSIEPDIDARTLTAFKRIRKNARNGLGIVYIQRNACGGCFNRIPPQKQMEIKMHKKVIVCEYCGRIMIDPELAGVEAPEQPASKK
ncbi:MAG: C4-type zinc ribbon domain-containing protein [Muribaculaceae bacterium]|nr:C4-type zinc ribbon domain-containing protein [Muribaculaceae bacterium]